MKVNTFVICESADNGGNGLFEIHNPIQEIAVSRLPIHSQPYQLPMGIRFEQHELVKHTVGFTITGPDGVRVYDRFELSAKVDETPGQDYTNFAWKLENLVLKLSRLGQHIAILRVEGRKVATWEFKVSLLQ